MTSCDSTQQEPDYNGIIIIMTTCESTQREPDNDRLIIMMTSSDSTQQEPDEGGEEGERPEASPGPSYAGMCVGSRKRTLTLLFFDIQCEMQCQCMYLNDF